MKSDCGHPKRAKDFRDAAPIHLTDPGIELATTVAGNEYVDARVVVKHAVLTMNV
jgi:hypothetical protein